MGAVNFEIHFRHLNEHVKKVELGFMGEVRTAGFYAFGHHQHINSIYSHRTATSIRVSCSVSFSLDNNSREIFSFYIDMISFFLYLINSYAQRYIG